MTSYPLLSRSTLHLVLTSGNQAPNLSNLDIHYILTWLTMTIHYYTLSCQTLVLLDFSSLTENQDKTGVRQIQLLAR